MIGPNDELYDNRGREIPVLIWCHTCRRYISHESLHYCVMSIDEKRERYAQRRAKVTSERKRVAA